MSRSPPPFRQSDVSRAIRAARAAGVQFSRVEIDPTTGKIAIVVVEGASGEASFTSDDLDRELADFEARHG